MQPEYGFITNPVRRTGWISRAARGVQDILEIGLHDHPWCDLGLIGQFKMIFVSLHQGTARAIIGTHA